MQSHGRAQLATTRCVEGPNVLLVYGMHASPGELQVYLEGELERGVVPLESAWMHDHGEGEDGCLLLLQKMNLELLQRRAPLPTASSML